MEGLDLSSLFKGKKKPVKAVKVAGSEQPVAKIAVEENLPIDAAVEAELVSATTLKMKETTEYKAMEEPIKKTSSVSWAAATQEQPEPAATVPEVKSSKYVPFRGAPEKPKMCAMPTLAESISLTKTTSQPKAEQQKPIEKTLSQEDARKQKEKEERRRQLQEDIMRTTSEQTTVVEQQLPEDCRITAAPFEQIAAKYKNRPRPVQA